MLKAETENPLTPISPVILKQDPDCTQYGMENAPVKLILTAYSVFPGIELVYNDIHAVLRIESPGKGARRSEKTARSSPAESASVSRSPGHS